MSPDALSPFGLALIQPCDYLVSDEDLVALASAEAMFRGQWAAERERAALAAVGIEHAYTLPRRTFG